MVNKNRLRYVEDEACTKRDDDMEQVKTVQCFKVDAATGLLKQLVMPQSDIRANLSTDLLLRNALTLRDLAFDNCRLVDHEAFER